MLNENIIKLLKKEDDLYEKMIIISYEKFKNDTNLNGKSYLKELYSKCNEKKLYGDKILFLANKLVEKKKLTYEELNRFGFREDMLKILEEYNNDLENKVKVK